MEQLEVASGVEEKPVVSTENTEEKPAADASVNGSQEEAKLEPCSEVDSQVIRQIEYYFGDVNLGRDKFLQLEIRKDDGWVPLSVLLTFNRLKQITEDTELICNALVKSPAKLMQINEDRKKIRRDPNKPLPENTQERRLQQNLKSVHVKGFPIATTLDTIESFMMKYGTLETIYMRRDDERNFKGSCWMTFAKLADAKSFVDKDVVKFDEEHALRRLFKEKYWAQKKAKRAKAGKVEKKQTQQEKKEAEEADIAQKLTKGAILKIWCLPEGLDRNTIKEAFSGHDCTVSWVDYDAGDREGRVRFQEADCAARVLKKLQEAGEDGHVQLKGQNIEACVLEGEEELAHWTAIYKDMEKKRRDVKRKRRDQRQNRRPMGGRNKRRKRDDGDDDDYQDASD